MWGKDVPLLLSFRATGVGLSLLAGISLPAKSILAHGLLHIPREKLWAGGQTPNPSHWGRDAKPPPAPTSTLLSSSPPITCWGLPGGDPNQKPKGKEPLKILHANLKVSLLRREQGRESSGVD